MVYTIIWIETDRLDHVSAQTVDSEPKSRHLGELGPWGRLATGVGTIRRELKVPSGITPQIQA